MVRAVVIFLCNHGAQTLLLHMTLHPFQAAWDTVLVQDAAYLHSSITTLGVIKNPLHLAAEFFTGLPPV